MQHQKTIKKIIAVMLVSLFVIPGLMLCVGAEAEYDFDEIIANGSEAISGYQAEIDEVESRNLLADSKLLMFTADGTTDERQHAILAAVSRYLYPDEEIEDLDTCLQMYDPDAGCGRIGLKFSGMAIFVPEYEDMAVAMLLLNTYPEVEGVELNFICRATDIEVAEEYAYDAVTGNIHEQWFLDTIGVMDAWDMGFVGTSTTIVAVLDSGCDDHPQLSSNVDFDLAYNVVDENQNVDDETGHGTKICGIIGAALDGAGVNGICQNIKIVPIKITTGPHQSNNVYMQKGIDQARQIGATVINLSYSLPELPQRAKEAFINEIEHFGNTVVFSAGNSGMDIEDDQANYGKVHDESQWLIVGASTSSNNIYSWSNYSAEYVDIFAPGEYILTTDINGGYATVSGTSFAAPMVAAAIALISSHATHKTQEDIYDIIMRNAEVPAGVNPFEGKCVTHGYLNIAAAILEIYEEERGAYSAGDASGNGYIEATDYLMTQRTALGTYTPTAQQAEAMDVNGSGSVDMTDYLMIRRYVMRTYYFVP